LEDKDYVFLTLKIIITDWGLGHFRSLKLVKKKKDQDVFNKSVVCFEGVPRETDKEREFADFDIFDDPETPYSTFNFQYSNQAFTQLHDLMEFNTLNNIEVSPAQMHAYLYSCAGFFESGSERQCAFSCLGLFKQFTF